MQMQMPELPHRIIITILLAHTGFFVLTASGGWALYQAAITHMNVTADAAVTRVTERLEPKIDANGQRIDELGERIDRNGERIDRNGEHIDRNGELIAQLRERMTALEVRVGAIEELVRFFHPPGDERQQGDP